MYNYKKTVPLCYIDAVAKVKDELIKEGFGVLTEIDVKRTLKAKLNVDFDDYIILGACNPKLLPIAEQASLKRWWMLPPELRGKRMPFQALNITFIPLSEICA